MPPERFNYGELLQAKYLYEQQWAKYRQFLKERSSFTPTPVETTCTPETICDLFKKWYEDEFLPWKIWVDSHFVGGPDPTSPPPVNSPYK